MIVLDASALLALLYREAGAERVAAALDSAMMSTVNLAEALARLARDGRDIGTVMSRLGELEIDFVPFSTEQAAGAARLLPITRAFGLSLGDRACLALALERRAVALTADRVWAAIGHGAHVEILR